MKQLVPRAGFAGLVAPGMVGFLRKHARQFDIVHVHLARDLITMPAAVIAGRSTRLVAQRHGQIVPDGRPKSRVVDAIATRRNLRGAGAVLYLTAEEKGELAELAPGLRLRSLPNGVLVRPAESTPSSGPVLFCARLHPRKRVLAFVEMAEILIQRGISADFVIAGPDGGDLPLLMEALAQLGPDSRIRYIGPVAPEQVGALLSSARVFVLPSKDVPFPMTVLEALAAGTPAVVTDTCAIGAELAALGAASVTDGSPEQLADSVEVLLRSPRVRQTQSDAGIAAIKSQYSITAVVDRLEEIYAEVVRRTP